MSAGKTSVAVVVKVFQKKADHHCALMNDALRTDQIALFRAHSRIASGFHQAVRILEKELKAKR